MNIISSIASFKLTGVTSELTFSGGGRTRTLTVVRRVQARSMRLSVDPRDATVRLSIPARAALRPALRWAAGQRDWIEAQLLRLPTPRPIVPGMVFAIGDAPVILDWAPDHARAPDLGDGVLHVGGPRAQLGARVLRHLRAHALAQLGLETRTLAALHGVTVRRVGVGDPRSRWGSCSVTGDIRYSWRLILAPDAVRRATVAHEVAHRVHMNHAPAFHALADEMNGGDSAGAHAWLRTHGTELHWFGRAG